MTRKELRYIPPLIILIIFLSCSAAVYFGKVEIDFNILSERGISRMQEVKEVILRNKSFHQNNNAFYIKNCSLVIPDSIYDSNIQNLFGNDIKIEPGNQNLLYIGTILPDRGFFKPIDGFTQYSFYIIVDTLILNQKIFLKNNTRNFSIAHIFGAPLAKIRYIDASGFIFLNKFQDGQLYGSIELQYRGKLPEYESEGTIYSDSSYFNLKGVFTIPEKKELTLSSNI